MEDFFFQIFSKLFQKFSYVYVCVEFPKISNYFEIFLNYYFFSFTQTSSINPIFFQDFLNIRSKFFHILSTIFSNFSKCTQNFIEVSYKLLRNDFRLSQNTRKSRLQFCEINHRFFFYFSRKNSCSHYRKISQNFFARIFPK